MRKERLFYNSVSSLVYQIILFLSGFILPRLIIGAFGSGINGLTNSITQYLSVISFLEFGIGAVVKSALYQPLAEKNNSCISKIMTSANRFFRRIAIILVIYTIILVFAFPILSNDSYDFAFSAFLIVAISISSFAQYFFGIVNQLLLTADQKVYICNIAQTITLIVNIIFSVLLIQIGSSIQIVKLVSSLVFLGRPIYLYVYVKKHYNISIHAKYEVEPIKQKWNGIAQHIAAVILDSTDIIVLSTFSTFANVSIYSVYRLVFNGLRTIVLTLNNGFGALLGDLWARKEIKTLNKVFGEMEWLFHTVTTLMYGCCYTMILSFVSLYTKGIHDTNYIQPFFAFIMLIAFALNCYTIPYHSMILAAGHYKQTQVYFILSAIINLVVSVITVSLYGLVGVAFGTFVAMLFQLFWMAMYISRHINRWPFPCFLKQLIIDVITLGGGILTTQFIVEKHIESYVIWIANGFLAIFCWGIIMIIVNFWAYRKKLFDIRKHLFKKK